jgi:hypothetical protein
MIIISMAEGLSIDEKDLICSIEMLLALFHVPCSLTFRINIFSK